MVNIMKDNNIELKLTQEQIYYLLAQSGAKTPGEALISGINLDLIKTKLVELVPQLSDTHKEELKLFLVKKFQLEAKVATKQQEGQEK